MTDDDKAPETPTPPEAAADKPAGPTPGEPLTDARDRYSIRYYLVAMLFVIFDVETVFMFPWAVIFNKLMLFGLIEMLVFIFILVVGYYYAWQKGALEWA